MPGELDLIRRAHASAHRRNPDLYGYVIDDRALSDPKALLTEQRDRARATAVALEQECARLERELHATRRLLVRVQLDRCSMPRGHGTPPGRPL